MRLSTHLLDIIVRHVCAAAARLHCQVRLEEFR